MPTEPNIESRLVEALMESIRQIPAAQAARGRFMLNHPDVGVDALIECRFGATDVQLAVEVKRTVFPRDAETVIWGIRRFLGANKIAGRRMAGLLAAESISEGARTLLENEGIGWFESGGAFHLSVGSVFIHVDRPPAKPVARSLRSIFRGSRAEVLHTLWERREDWFGATGLASLAGVSPGTASEMLMELERRGWVETRGAGPAKERKLSNAAELIDAWADAARHDVSPRPIRRVFVGGRGDIPSRFAVACAEAGVKYAFTGQFAAQRYAPFLTAVPRAQCWGAPGCDDVLDRLNARTADEGWNLAVETVKGDGVFRRARQVDGLCLATPLQVFLDLQRGSGRSKEMAEYLRRETLGA